MRAAWIKRKAIYFSQLNCMKSRNPSEIFCAAIIACCFIHPTNAQDLASVPQEKVQDTFLLRPQAGSGVMEGAQYQHAGFRFLLNASETKKYGLEYSRISTAQGDYIARGIVLEDKKFDWLNLSIGSVGYFGQGAGMQNLPGLVGNIGWEPSNKGAFRPFATYRYDMIYGSKTLVGNSFSIGLAVSF
jgi:hypothetical protein